jgi:hypothetical protein
MQPLKTEARCEDLKWLAVRLGQAGIDGWEILDLPTEDIDEAQKRASEWEEENFHTIGCVIVFDRTDVEDLSKICNEVLAAS